MAQARGTLDAVIVPVAEAIGVVGDLIGQDNGADLIAQLGYSVPGAADLASLFSDLGNAASDLTNSIIAIRNAYDDGSWEDPSFIKKVLDLGAAVVEVVEIAQKLPDRAETAFSGAADFLNNAPLDELPRRLVDFLVVGYLREQHPAIASFLHLAGLTSQTFVPEGTYNPDFYLIEVRWERFPTLFSSPGTILTEEYGWGTADLRSDLFLDRLKGFLWLVGLPSTSSFADSEDPTAPRSTQLEVPLFQGAITTPADGLAGVELGLRLRRSDNAADATDSGLAIVPYAEGSFDIAIELTKGWELSADADLSAEGLSLHIHPHSGVRLDTTVSVAATLGITLGRDGSVLGPLVLFGNSDGTRLQVGQISQRLLASASTSGDVDVGIELALKELALVVMAGEGDGFLQSVLPKEPLSFNFDLTVGISAKRGVYVTGGAGLERTFHVDTEIGPIFIKTIDLAVPINASGMGLRITVTGGLAIGPLVAVVEGIGLEAKIQTGRPGNLGNANLALAFRPPTGIGLSIDTPTVKAGGFLSIDVERGRYVGAIELSVLEKFDLVAVGVITTRMPDGSEGFSLLFIIAMTFPSPIPLSYNFYLAGAGGLLGLSRSMDVDRLRDGLRAGTADNILFPTDVIRRIDPIVRDLEQVFPPVAGQFLVGPMVLINWSSPPLITIKLGLIIEIGSPIRVAILGVLRAALPDPKEPVLDLKVAFLGTVDLQAGLLSFDAAIYDSYIGRGDFKLRFEGDIAVRLSWGGQADFVTSVGGFHPLFKPSAHLRLPAMRRITLSLLKDNPRVTLTTYFAVTTNTVQFGARLAFYFSVSSFSIVGDFGFDVLFQFSPFKINADVWARLAVRSGNRDVMSLSLDFNLQGPTPWITKGTARFKILFFSVSVRFEKRFGEEAESTLPDIEVLPILLQEMGRDANWRAELGRGATAQVQVLPVTPQPGTLVIDAGGALTVSQRALPLDTDFTLFGTSRPSDARRVVVREMRLGTNIATTSPVLEPFAPAAFQEMSDRDKLAAPPYEPRASGVQATGGRGLRTDHILALPVSYEMLVSDSVVGGAVSRTEPQPEPQGRFESLVPGGAAGRSPSSRRRARLRQEGSVLDVGDVREQFVVARVSDLRPIGANGQPATPVGTDSSGRPRYADGVVLDRTDAEARLAELVAGGESAETLGIIPQAQLAA